MRTHLQDTNREPMRLRDGVIFFHDWRHVNHGYPGWHDASGGALSVFSTTPLPEVHFNPGDIPYGVRLQTLAPTKTAPVLQPQGAWEGVIGSPTVIHEGDRYRLWYECVPPTMVGGGHANYLCYAESTDGVTWTRPAFTFVPYGEHTHTNIVYGGDLAGPWGLHGSSVFLDPGAPPAERYKLIFLARLTHAEIEALAAQGPDRVAAWPAPAEVMYALAAAVSPDGLSWTRLPEPLVGHCSDTQNTCSFDPTSGQYVWFGRTWVLGRRSLGRAASVDFRHFPLPETIRWPGADVGPTDTWYGNGKTLYPGTQDYHLLFPWRWQVADDAFYTHFAVSPDGILWSAPPGDQVLAPGARGAWDSGGTVSGCGLVELPGARLGLLYVGYHVPHKFPRRPPLGQFAWTTWEHDRLVALAADERGECHTWVMQVAGNSLQLNGRTRHTGEMRIGLLGSDRRPIPGRAIEDCDGINGDFTSHVVTWNGDPRLFPEGEPTPLAFQIYLRQAELFSLRIQ